jgi:hypothetical protein
MRKPQCVFVRKLSTFLQYMSALESYLFFLLVPSIIRLGIIIPFQIQILKHSACLGVEKLQKSFFHLFLLGLYLNTLCALGPPLLEF